MFSKMYFSERIFKEFGNNDNLSIKFRNAINIKYD